MPTVNKSLTELAQMYNPCIRGWITCHSFFLSWLANWKSQVRLQFYRAAAASCALRAAGTNSSSAILLRPSRTAPADPVIHADSCDVLCQAMVVNDS